MNLELIHTTENIDFVVTAVGYGFFFFGLLWLLSHDLYAGYQKIRTWHNEKTKKVKIRKGESGFDKKIRYLLAATFGKGKKISVTQFKTLTIILFIMVFGYCVRFMNFSVAAVIAGAVAAMPFVALRLYLERIRAKSSHEAEILVSEILIKYRIKDFNIEEAIEAIDTKEIQSTGRLMSKLLMRLRSTRQTIEIREATDMFAYAVGTNWAKMLASNIYQASISHMNICLSLEDILLQLREAANLREQRRRNISEPRRLLWFIPILYAFLALVSVHYLGITFPHYLGNQFNTGQGLILISFCFIGMLISYFFVTLISSKKLDY